MIEIFLVVVSVIVMISAVRTDKKDLEPYLLGLIARIMVFTIVIVAMTMLGLAEDCIKTVLN